jgi:hypothetical protein
MAYRHCERYSTWTGDHGSIIWRRDAMTELPENVTLDWLGRQFMAQRDDLRALRTDVDMLIRLVIRVDHTLDAVREDIRSLWSQDGDLRRRIEALERPQA